MKQEGVIGIVLYAKWYEPFRNITADHIAAKRALTFALDWYNSFIHGFIFSEIKIHKTCQ